ncbi:hypothetical protein ACJDU8_24715 [Clostridium sp. WILCCON 0269]|uniref:Uncharacterized protein n=1 Tax=Candidatus Clostridium eludens TaxID=3381663 RepID=A0ABW8SSF2_9CLOT
MDVCYGGWIVHEYVSDKDKQVLNIALQGFVGSTFVPIAVATQVVNGINYLFIAKSITATLPPKTGLAKIYVAATPAGHKPRLVNIEKII